jgi:predicted MFS family arabinose efflux permease
VAVLIRDEPAAPGSGARSLAATHGAGLMYLIWAYGLFGFGYVITATFLVVIVRASPGLRPLEPIIWLVFGLAAAPSVAAWTAISRRLGIPTAFALACVVEAAGVFASIVWPSEPGTFLSAILVGGTFMGLTALGLVQAGLFAGADSRRVLALATGAFGFGQIVGPAFAGLAAERFGGFDLPLAAAIVALLIAAALVLRLRT